MSTVVVSQVIDAEAAYLWRLLTELPTRISWMSTIDGIDVLTKGPFQAGTAWREARTMADGTRVTEEFKVGYCDQGRSFVVSSPGAGADYRLTYTLSPIDEGRHRGSTEVTIEQEGHARGSAGKVLELVLGGLAARTAEGALWQELSDLAEAAATVTRSSAPPAVEPAAPAVDPAGPAAT